MDEVNMFIYLDFGLRFCLGLDSGGGREGIGRIADAVEGGRRGR